MEPSKLQQAKESIVIIREEITKLEDMNAKRLKLIERIRTNPANVKCSKEELDEHIQFEKKIIMKTQQEIENYKRVIAEAQHVMESLQ